jgi:hypothetical protein
MKEEGELQALFFISRSLPIASTGSSVLVAALQIDHNVTDKSTRHQLKHYSMDEKEGQEGKMTGDGGTYLTSSTPNRTKTFHFFSSPIVYLLLMTGPLAAASARVLRSLFEGSMDAPTQPNTRRRERTEGDEMLD